ncbi:MAG: hypothetical protein WD032_08855 [Nitrospirales bacterium]
MTHSEIIQLIVAYTLVGALVFTVIITCLSVVGWIKLADDKQQEKLFYITIVQLVVGCVAFFFNFIQFDAVQVEKNIAEQAILAAQLEQIPPYYGDSVRGNVRPQMEAYICAFTFPEGSKLAQEAESLLEMIEENKYPDEPQDYFNANNEFRGKLDTFRNNVRAYTNSGNWPKN